MKPRVFRLPCGSGGYSQWLVYYTNDLGLRDQSEFVFWKDAIRFAVLFGKKHLKMAQDNGHVGSIHFPSARF